MFQMFQYSFFERDLAALRKRCQALIDQTRAMREQLSQTAVVEAASQDGATHRLARDHSDVVMSQLRSMQDWIAHAQIVNPEPFDGTVRMGTVVMLKDISTGEYGWYCISSFWCPEEGEGTQKCPTNISYATPLARGLMCKRTGDDVIIKIREGKTTSYTIMDVTPGPYELPAEVAPETQPSAA